MTLSAKILYGLQVRLRPINKIDIETIRLWRNKDSIRRWFVYSGIISPEQQLSWWEKYDNTEDEIMFMIESLPDNTPVGTVSLYKIIPGDTAEFGRLMIGEEMAHGKGYAYEATKLITQFGFEAFNLKNIYLEVFSDNIAARMVYEKSGFSIVENITKNNGLIAMTISANK